MSRLLVDADDERVRRRVEVEAEDRRLLGLELGVGAAPAPVGGAVRSQISLAQDAVHRGGTEAAGSGEAPDAPAARAVRGLGGREGDHGEALLGADLQGSTAARPVGKAAEPLLKVAPPPGGDGLGGKAGRGADRSHRLAGGGQQHDLRALPETMLAPARRGPLVRSVASSSLLTSTRNRWPWARRTSCSRMVRSVYHITWRTPH